LTKPNRRFWTLAAGHEDGFIAEFGSFVRGEAIDEMKQVAA
jgi:hypothetical protein